ncbi:MAG: 50S ribosomal protein L15 [Candidatus Humimicrobiaceae bacterium]|nr:50S ribosomal protein L15 [Actinomycetota bacterium]MDD5600507.1 50S ribosomal protein L15 [Actinomycetota bacterium]MDY0027909.1 50S ribosomal protein L15 [Candidatus Humimicrobiaceae bacterium]
MKLCDLDSPESIKKRKRVGRGNSSGHGTTCGKGTKGQLSRSGGKTRIGFEGGQMPLQRRLPHLKGFKNTRKKENNIINVGQLDRFNEDSVIDYDFLEKNGLIIRKTGPIKILGKGEITKKVTVRANFFSKTAIDKIEKAGGKVEVV